MEERECSEFEPMLSRLERSRESIRTLWTDSNATSYDVMNENIKILCNRIWMRYCDACEGERLIKANYDKDEIDKSLNELAAQIDSV